MKNIQIIQEQISDSINTKHAVLETLAPTISSAGELLVTCLEQGNKILCCGNGGSASDAQHFAAELLGRYVRARQSLPAIALNTDTSTITAIANDFGFAQVFAKQIQALGRTGDVLLAISTSGNSENICTAIIAAQQANMQVLTLTGNNGGKIAAMLNANDINICIPSKTTSRIQESHILVLHCLCEVIDNALIGS